MSNVSIVGEVRRIVLLSIIVVWSQVLPAQTVNESVDPSRYAGDVVQADGLGGQIRATVGDALVVLPMLSTDYEVTLLGEVATVDVRQVFTNPLTQPVNASYLFPLNNDAAVHKMRISVANEVIEAQIKTVEQATKTFAEAKKKGKSAALLRQHRPNMFTQEIANLMPGYPVTVVMRYTQTLAREEGRYSLNIPFVVGPRYRPPVIPGAPRADGAPATPLQYPPAVGIDLPDTIDRNRVSLAIDLRAGFPIVSARSPTHGLVIDADTDRHWRLRLDTDSVLANRDFEFRFAVASDGIQSGVLSDSDLEGGYFSLLIEPPAMAAAEDIGKREMVFVLDASGSMAGVPIRASKAFMHAALRTLRPTDFFRVIRFSDLATEYSSEPLPATPGNIARALAYTDRLKGSGGTEMSSGIRQALEVPIPADTLRIVSFLTDGYIGNENEILGLIHRLIGRARLFALGVGTAPNRFLLDEMALVGRGFVRYMDPTEDVDALAAELAERLRAPLLTDISVDWDGLDVSGVYPAKIPDLFAGDSVRLIGRYHGGGERTLTVRGRSVEGEIAIPISTTFAAASRPLRVDQAQLAPVAAPRDTLTPSALGIIWARSAVRDRMQTMRRIQFAAIGQADTEALEQQIDALQRDVTGLGLSYGLVTKWTAFVAVSTQVYNPQPLDSVDAVVPLEGVEAVSQLAYGESTAPPRALRTPPANGQFVGSSTPEPLPGLAIIVSLLFLTGWLAVHSRGRRVTVRY